MSRLAVFPVYNDSIACPAKTFRPVKAKTRSSFGQENDSSCFLFIPETNFPPNVLAGALVSLSPVQAMRDGLLYTVRGSLQNTSGTDFTYIQVNFPLYDVQGYRQGTAACHRRGLKAGEIWRFAASALDMANKVSFFGAEQLVAW